DIDAHRHRAIARLYGGSPAQALAELEHANELSPQNPYVALGLEIASRRSTGASRFRQAAARISMTEWPAPLIALFRDEIAPDALLQATDDPKPRRKRQQL